MTDELAELIWQTDGVEMYSQAVAIASALRGGYLVIPFDGLAEETIIRNHVYGCTHRYRYHHGLADPCPRIS